MLTRLASDEHGASRGLEDAQSDLRQCLKSLETFLQRGFKDAFDDASACAEEYFREKSGDPHPPRLCVKVFVADKLVTLARNTSPVNEEESYYPHENTAFTRIVSSANNISKKQYYLCNDIPLSVGNSTYVNARIDAEKVAAYNLDHLKGELNYNNDGYDWEWIKCWRGSPGENNNSSFADSCYESTLVIPMSLLTGNMNSEFLDHYRIPAETNRAVFGFLCFDHRRRNFFDPEENVDVNFAYILADVLSLYLIQQLAYTQYSKVYYSASSIVEAKLVNSI